MTTPGNNGEHTSNAPEGDDDPFGYLYADGQAKGATPPSGGGGYGYPGPRSSYNSINNVRAVGERQYGQQQYGQQAPGVPPQQPQAQAYGQPNAHYAAPETQPGGAPRQTPPPAAPGRGRGPNTKGLLIAAIAVVATVAIGIGAAVVFGGDKDSDDGKDQASGKPSQAESVKPSEKASKKPETPGELPKSDAKALKLGGGTTTASDIDGARAAGGVYVAGLNKVGAQVTWTVNGIPKDGEYTLFVGYGVPGKAAETTLVVNGTPSERKLNMDNFAHAADGAWDKGWTQTFAWIHLNKGTNTLTVSCQDGDKCDANLDQVWLKAGHVKK